MNRIYFLTKSSVDSGNFQSAKRVATLFLEAFPYAQQDIFNSKVEFSLKDTENVLFIGIHLRRTGDFIKNFVNLFLTKNCKLVVICGGTDLYEEIQQAENREKMSEVVKIASGIVFFNEQMRTEFLKYWPNYFGILMTIPQSIDLSIREIDEKKTRKKQFLWVGRIRSVKDPLNALINYCHWKNENKRLSSQYNLLFIGSIENKDDSRICQFLEALKNVQDCSLRWIESLPRPLLHQLMNSSIALINSSRNEGQCLTIMEAQLLNLPVLARKNAGNESLINHMVTGCLYQDKDSFIRSLNFILSDEGETMTKWAKIYAENFTRDKERENYVSLIKKLEY